MINVDEEMLKRLIQEILNELNQKNCNTPILMEAADCMTFEGVSRTIPRWDVCV